MKKRMCFLNEEVSVKLEGGRKNPEHPAENTREDKEQDEGEEEMNAETTNHSKAERDEL